MNIILGFAGRIGRLQYFVLSLVLAAIMTLLVFMLIGAMMPHPGGATEDDLGTTTLIIAAIVMPVFLWFSLALQAKRFRDIGWAPLYVIPGWIGAIALDRIVAFLVPALALSGGHGTIAGVLINLVMVAALLFVPGGARGGGDFSDLPARAKREPEQRAHPAVTPSQAAPVRAPGPAGFGRRAV